MTSKEKELELLIEKIIHTTNIEKIPHNSIIMSLINKEEYNPSIKKELKRINDLIYFNNIFFDTIGTVYQKLQNSTDKKNKGQFFTPSEIVDSILIETLDEIQLEKLWTIKILDPSCGSGQFLIKVYEYLLKKYQQNGVNNKDAINNIIHHNIFGYDIDLTAIEITKYNLSRISGIKSNDISTIKQNDFIYKDSLSIEQEKLNENQYDIIIGNPPWGSSLTAEQKKYYRTIYYSAKSGINTFTLFIERSLELLKENGTLSYLVPESLLNIKAHMNCREILTSECKITTITLWGEQFENVFAPSISFNCQKNSTHNKDNTIIIHNKKSHKYNKLYLKQSYVHKSPEKIISFHFSENTLNLLDHISSQECFFLKNKAKFFLGIVTGNNNKFISNSYTEATPDKIIMGKDIQPYQVHYSGHYFKYDSNKLQQTAPKELYLAKNKFLYKFIGKRLTFAIDRESRFTLNNVNGFIPDMDSVSAEAMLALLNSSLIQYFYEKNFFTVKVLKGNLERLPLKKLNSEAQRLLSTLSNQAKEADLLNEKNLIQDKIDEIVLSQYSIPEKESYLIWESARKSNSQPILPNL
jgi:type I restriction-modification system DNA methylase subunit